MALDATLGHCPDCGSPLTRSRSLQLVVSILGTIGVLMWIPVLGWIAIPILLVALLFVLLIAVFQVGKRYCLSCGWVGRKRQVRANSRSAPPAQAPGRHGVGGAAPRRRLSPCARCGQKVVPVPFRDDVVDCRACGYVAIATGEPVSDLWTRPSQGLICPTCGGPATVLSGGSETRGSCVECGEFWP